MPFVDIWVQRFQGNMSKFRVCAVIVAFNPEIERLHDNVSAVTKQVDELLIIDNGSENLQLYTEMLSKNNFRYCLIALGENKGIGGALNEAISYCVNFDIEYLLTLDQDSVITHFLVKNLMDTIFTADNIAMVGPQILDLNVRHSPINTKIENAFHLITSGSLCRVSHLDTVGRFNEHLFIDCVDFDMSLKLLEADYRVLRNNQITLLHEIGRKKQMMFFGMKFSLLNHPESRVYFMVRNRLCIIHRYWNLKGYRPLTDVKHLLTRTLAMLIFEDNKTAKFFATIKGFFDYLLNYKKIMK
jgi:rhamnosyltransferase